MKLIGRLAPSPTGAQHVGNARTYLIAWLSARSRGGRVILRIEDIDSPRVKAGAAASAVEDVRWLGLDWDEGPVVQTARLPLYESAFERLKSAERVYPCVCSRLDVERAASAPHAEHEGPAYPGTCAARSVRDADSLTGPFAWRFRLGGSETGFDDAFKGRIDIDLKTHGGDFVAWKSAGTPAYQLAVVVDDADQQVTEIVRGDDLIPSTPRQLLLYHALDWQPPCFYHVPLVVGPDGQRLAKRHGDTRLATLRDNGVSANALVGLLAWSCGWIPYIEPIAARDLLPLFRWDTIPHQPLVLTAELLQRIGFAG